MVFAGRVFYGLIVLMLVAASAPFASAADAKDASRPNVLLIVTDDQGWGDVGVHGNPKIHTPNLDRLAKESTELTRFYVSPVCAPTRACLMTGRYNYRTGVTDTYMGRAMMHPDEVTIAELLRGAGYRTGIFGKWHLGDNCPLRPMEQGFDTALVHNGGGMSQPGDPLQGAGYFHSWLERNGHPERVRGYCSDVYTREAISYIDAAKEPWFVYLPFNAPHFPLEVPAEELAAYKDAGLDTQTARIYAMVSNIDRNVGRVLEALKKSGQADNTIVIFFNDNGPATGRFNGNLRGQKANVYEGGIRAMCFVRWPGHFPAGQKIDTPTAHIDLLPTLAAACDAKLPSGLQLDGVNLLGLLESNKPLAPRKLFVQWHRADAPQSGRNCAVIDGDLKLVQPTGMGPNMPAPKQTWELYDLSKDPGEQHDLSKERPTEVARLKKAYEAWLADVSKTRGYDAPRTRLGDIRQPELLLSRQDMRYDGLAEGEFKSQGYWAVDIAPRRYDVLLHLDPMPAPGQDVILQVGDRRWTSHIPMQSIQAMFENIELPPGDQRLRLWFSPYQGPQDKQPPQLKYVEILAK